MKEELISFETAKLAKEKGFNEPQFNDYLNEQLEKYTSKSTHEQCIEEYYLAPTQGLLQKWLRDIYNIDVEAPLVYRLNTRKYQVRIYRHNTKIILSTFHYYNTYEEALEEGLYQALLLV